MPSSSEGTPTQFAPCLRKVSSVSVKVGASTSTVQPGSISVSATSSIASPAPLVSRMFLLVTQSGAMPSALMRRVIHSRSSIRPKSSFA